MANQPKFEMRKAEDGIGVYCAYTTGSGIRRATVFDNPSDSIDHVCVTYLRGRFDNVRNHKQANFIKRRYKEEIGKYKESSNVGA